MYDKHHIAYNLNFLQLYYCKVIKFMMPLQHCIVYPVDLLQLYYCDVSKCIIPPEHYI